MNVIIDNYDEIQNDNEDIIFEWKKSLRDMKSMKTNETWIFVLFVYNILKFSCEIKIALPLICMHCMLLIFHFIALCLNFISSMLFFSFCTNSCC